MQGVGAGPSRLGAEGSGVDADGLQRERVAGRERRRPDQHDVVDPLKRLRANLLADQDAGEIAGQGGRRHALEEAERACPEGVVQQPLAVAGTSHAAQARGLVERGVGVQRARQDRVLAQQRI